MVLESIPPPQLATRSCLVVDDSPVVRSLFRSALQRIPGVRVTVAADGVEALRCLSRDRFDLVLADLDAPALGALGIAARMREGAHRDVPVVVVANGRDESARAVARQLAVSAWVVRPVQAGALQSLARQLLNIP